MRKARGRVVAYVDGMNVYYSLRKQPELKWLDYWSLCAAILPSKAELEGVRYFTALFNYEPRAVARHRLYIRALATRDVKPIYGKFKRRDQRCRLYDKTLPAARRCAGCPGVFWRPEEKQTDVNIAVHLLTDARNDLFDSALLVTGDTDLLPLIEMMHAEFPAKIIGAFVPPARRSKVLREAVDFYIKMKQRHLRSCQLPDKIVLRDGSTVERPPSWRAAGAAPPTP